jgi:hypothetical protein
MRLSAAAVIACIALAACTTTNRPSTRETATRTIEQSVRRTDSVMAQAETTASTLLPLLERVDRPYLGKRTTTLADETQMPPILQKDVSVAMLFDDGSPRTPLGDVEVPIQVFAERLTRATGVPTRVRPDVYLPLAQLVSGRAQTQLQAAAGAAAGQGAAQRGNDAPASAIGAPRSVTVTMPARLVAPVPQLLELINARLGINSRYTQEGVLEFYRLATATFTVAVQPGDVSYSSQLGQTSTGGTNFTSTANVASQMQARAFSSVVEAVRSMLTPAGTLVGTEITRQITVTDTREVLDAVRAHIRSTNRSLGSQIAVNVQVFNCVDKSQTNYGVDWLAK